MLKQKYIHRERAYFHKYRVYKKIYSFIQNQCFKIMCILLLNYLKYFLRLFINEKNISSIVFYKLLD